jgi:FkbM family methyltransferase
MSLSRILLFIKRHPFNQGHFISALWRFLCWQLVSRFFRESALIIPWVNDVRLIAHRGEAGVSGNVYCGLHEFESMAFTLHLLRDTDSFVDVGANSGTFTLLACGAAGANGISIEPGPQSFQRLQDHIALNHLQTKVKTLNAAVGAESCHVRFTVDQDTKNHVIADEHCDNSISVPMLTLDEICDGRAPTLIKIDVEGYETFVLKGGRRIFADPQLQAVILENNDCGVRYGIRRGEIVAQLLSLGFQAAKYSPFERTLTVIGQSMDFYEDLIFVRDPHATSKRLVESALYRVLDRLI